MNTKHPKNPERKQALQQAGELNYNSPEFKKTFVDYIRQVDYADIDVPELQEIKRTYTTLSKSLPPRAEMYLSKSLDEYINTYKRPKTGGYEKIYENQGVQVFLDTENVEGDFSPGSYYHRMISHGVNNMLNYIKDILPNRKPKIVITDLKKNNFTKKDKALNPTAEAMQASKTIFIDWTAIESMKAYIHEYAHYVADLIPQQTEAMLIDAYKKLIDDYFRAVKRKKVDPSEITDKMRQQISRKLNFPEYGLENHHELFAIIIEFWKQFPNNPLTYKFKSLVKNVLARV